MRTNTYCRLDNLYKNHRGYISTRVLMDKGFTNRQIAVLAAEGYLEKVCHGYYWLIQKDYGKPYDYKCIEVCLSNPRAVISMKSACFYQGIVKEEPEFLTVATERTDRSRIKLNFPVERHFFSGSNFQIGLRNVKTEFGCYNMYDIERSICDMIRLDYKNTDGGFVAEIMDPKRMKRGQYERVLRYAQILNIKSIYDTGVFAGVSLQDMWEDGD